MKRPRFVRQILKSPGNCRLRQVWIEALFTALGYSGTGGNAAMLFDTDEDGYGDTYVV